VEGKFLLVCSNCAFLILITVFLLNSEQRVISWRNLRMASSFIIKPSHCYFAYVPREPFHIDMPEQPVRIAARLAELSVAAVTLSRVLTLTVYSRPGNRQFWPFSLSPSDRQEIQADSSSASPRGLSHIKINNLPVSLLSHNTRTWGSVVQYTAEVLYSLRLKQYLASPNDLLR
jgi:hypothetical protein